MENATALSGRNAVPPVLRRIAWLLIAAALSSCSILGSGQSEARATALEASVSTYAKLIRWAYYDEAAKYVRGRGDKVIKVDMDAVSRYRVTEYTVVDQRMSADGTEAVVTAAIEYYEIDTGILHTLRDKQYWWYSDKDSHWYLGSPFPAFGAGIEQ